jgi:hypothetical protein
MNIELYNKLIKQYEDETPVTAYFRSIKWVDRHLKTLCEKFGWLSIGTLVKYTIDDTTRVSKVERFIINDDSIFVDTGFSNIWYYECIKPTKEEISKFDNHCLIIK